MSKNSKTLNSECTCSQNSLQIEKYNGTIDFAYAFMMIHEVENREQLLTNIYSAMKKMQANKSLNPKNAICRAVILHKK